MHYNFLIGIWVFMFAIGSFSCKQDSVNPRADSLTLVPNQAVNVTSARLGKLMEKADMASLNEMEFFAEFSKMMGEEFPGMESILSDPEKSGLDFSQNAYQFVIPPDGEGESAFVGLTFSIADVEAFENMVKSLSKGELPGRLDKKGGFSWVSPGRGNVIAWSEGKAVVGSSVELNNVDKKMGAFFNLKPEESIASNPNLNKAFNDSHDIVSWVNFDDYVDQMPDYLRIQLGIFGYSVDDLKGNYLHSTADFENGEVIAKGYYDLKDAISKDVNLIFKSRPATDFSPFVPSNALGSYLSLALDLNGINQLIKEKGIGGTVNLPIIRYGLNTEMLAKALNGDLMTATFINDQTGTMDFLFAGGLADEDSFNKILSVGEKKGILKKNGDNSYSLIGSAGMFNNLMRDFGGKPSAGQKVDAKLIIHENLMFISSNPEILEQILKGGFKKDEQYSTEFQKSAEKSPMGLYIDLREFRKVLPGSMQFDFDEMEVRADGESTDLRLKSSHPEENSLKSILKMINGFFLDSRMKMELKNEDKKLSQVF